MVTPTVSASANLADSLGSDVKNAVSRWAMQELARRLLPRERLASCNRAPARGGGGVRAVVSGSKGFFRGVVRCANPWACPICAPKISTQRGQVVQAGIDAALAYGNGVSLVTLTVRHGVGMQLKQFLPTFAKTLRRFKSGRPYAEWRTRWGFKGEVRALEVTHGKNGWHPHTHAVTFTRFPVEGHDITRMKRELFVLWRRACEREGLPLPTYKHGVDVRGAKYAAEYVAKWGFAAELTQTHMKKGWGAGRNPWQLLADSASDKKSAWLFREFALTFKGRRQLLWSRGLQRYLGVDGADLTDQQSLDLAEPEAPEEVEHFIEPDDWSIACKLRARGDLLQAAVEGSLREFLENLRARARDYCGFGRDSRRHFEAWLDGRALDGVEAIVEPARDVAPELQAPFIPHTAGGSYVV